MPKDDKDWKSQVNPLSGSRRKPLDIQESEKAHLAKISKNYDNFDIKIDENKTVYAKRADVSHTLLRELASDRVPIDASVDLHGFTREEARSRVICFVQHARSAGYRTLLVIHGKGLHTQDGVGVLGEEVLDTLCRGEIASWVLALTTAHRRWGGTGALVVKLTRKQ